MGQFCETEGCSERLQVGRYPNSLLLYEIVLKDVVPAAVLLYLGDVSRTQ